MAIKTVMEWVTRTFEMTGVLVIIGGFVLAAARTLQARAAPAGTRYRTMRGIFGRSVLLGLEILVAADLIRTVAVAPTLDNLLALGLLVVIRTFLSWSLEVEMEGVLPWKRHEAAQTAPAPDEEA